YIVAISIPVLILINSPLMFGYAGVSNRFLVNLLIFFMSAGFGLALAKLVKNQNAFNITFTIASFINLLYGLGLVIIKQSNVTHKVAPIVSMVLYVVLLIFSISILFISAENIKNHTIKTKTNIIYAVSVLLVGLTIGYTIISNFVAFNFISPKIYKDKFLKMVGNELNIPLVEVYTQNNQEPYSKQEYVNCSFKISNCETEEYNFSVPMTKNYKDDGCVGIRLRGNSTRKARKRPYRIKFDEKQSLFGLKSNKSWVLLAEFYDQSYIRNYTAFTLADSFDNLDFAPTPHHVALMINDEFKGLYLLCEQIDEKKGRANVDDDFDVSVDTEFPFLLEMDARACMEGVTGIDNFYVESADNHVEIKYPEADERGATATSDIVYDYIYEYINAVFTTMKTGEKVEVSFRNNPIGLSDLVNINSIVDFYLINEIMLNVDSAYHSIYLHKTKDGLMQFGPIWDFDLSLSTKLDAPFDKSYTEETDLLWLAQNSPIYQYLFKSETLFEGKTFYELVAERFNVKKQSIIDTCNYLKDYKATIDKVALIDARMWHGITGEFQYDMQYDYLRLFLMDRYDYLDNVFALSRTEFLDLI
ncbi:MAG: CotH kinase family protein, partial [Clostridia bacterium]